MGKEFQMACSEAFGQRMLLATGRDRISRHTPCSGDEREEAAASLQGAKGSKIKDPKAAGKAGAKAKDSNGGSARRQRPRCNDKDRKSDRRPKGKDKALGRSASELGIEWNGSYCPDGHPHFFVDVSKVYEGALFKCGQCQQHKWLPVTTDGARALSLLMGKYGTAGGYRVYLDSNRPAKVLMAKLQDLWYARQRITDDGQFTALVIAVMADKEYDKKEVA